MAPRNYQWYQGLKKPAITPPHQVFTVVWTILYIMIGLAGYKYVEKAGLVLSPGLIFYFLQLVLNLLWSPLFFWQRNITLALVDAILLWACVAVTIYFFSRENETAAYLLVPYQIWLCVAVYLNLYIVIYNKAQKSEQKSQ